MSGYSTILASSAPVFVVIALGAAFRLGKVFPGAGDPPLISLVLNVLYPTLIVKNVLGNSALTDARLVAVAMTSGFLALAASLGVGWLAARVLRLKEGAGRRTFPLAVGVQNYGLLPIPIIEALYPQNATELLGVTFLFILGLELATWTLGISCLGASDGRWRRALNVPMCAIVASLALNALGAGEWLPQVARKTIQLLAGAAIPVNLLLVGGTLASFFGECHWRGCAKVALGGSVVRFAILPAMYFAAAALLPLSPALRLVMVIQGAMPAAVFPVLLAKHYGGHVPTAVQTVIVSSLLGVPGVPLLILAGKRVCGLE